MLQLASEPPQASTIGSNAQWSTTLEGESQPPAGDVLAAAITLREQTEAATTGADRLNTPVDNQQLFESNTEISVDNQQLFESNTEISTPGTTAMTAGSNAEFSNEDFGVAIADGQFDEDLQLFGAQLFGPPAAESSVEWLTVTPEEDGSEPFTKRQRTRSVGTTQQVPCWLHCTGGRLPRAVVCRVWRHASQCCAVVQVLARGPLNKGDHVAAAVGASHGAIEDRDLVRLERCKHQGHSLGIALQGCLTPPQVSC